MLLGDSITERGDWDDLLPDRPVSNHGYSGYTSEQLVPVAEDVAADRPRLVLVLTGTNDIRDGHGPEWTIRRLEQIIERFQSDSPATRVVLQTVLPRADAPAEVLVLNGAIVELASARGLAVLDLHPLFDDGRGGLRSAETTDGLHLSAAGYERWAAVLDRDLDGLLDDEPGPAAPGS